MIRVFVVDDSAFARRATTRVLQVDPELQVVGEAANGSEALARIPAVRPDVVTLDLDMPGINGLAALKALLIRDPTLRIIMLSAHTKEGAEATLEALAAGATDFLDKSRFGLMDLEGFGRELRDRVRALGSRRERARPGENGRNPAASTASRPVPPGLAHTRPLAIDLCVLGASTGGPAAIQRVLELLPADFPVPIAIVQHMPPGFTAPFASRLNAHCRLAVSEARDGDQLVAGQVVIAPAGRHITFTSNLTVVLSPEPLNARHVPSATVMMLSASRVRPGRVLGVLLTGMGDDGADGMLAIRAGGGVTVAESEESCVVYGMPRAAAERGGVDRLLPIGALAEWLAGVKAGFPATTGGRR
ncbi:MAG TPA: chemotaxis-specific protein-glutamate methyltransferase CheB [Gemmatimonadales bacterium]|nr:chemotaxis-specific protein-glutamate methyltransferase CheB [Gemmatimonadales bacterium]